MKIAIINTVGTRRNGITNVICNLLSAMDGEIRFDLICTSEPEAGYAEMMAQRGGQLHVVSRSMRDPIGYVRRLKELLVREGYDAIHVHGNSATMALEMLAAKKAKCPVRIAHSHNTTCKYQKIHKLLWPVFQKNCTHRLACGEDAGKWLYGNREFTVVNNGINTARFAYNRENREALRIRLGVGQAQTVIGHVGVFNEAKNQSFLVDMMAHLPQSYRLVLVGTGAMQPQVEEKAKGLGDRVIFAGVTDRVEDYLSAFDLLVMPSLYEGLPLSLMEAQASGLKCLVSENITREVDKTGQLTFASLDAGAENWAARVQGMTLPDRACLSAQAAEKIKACGYDIYAEAAKMKEYYAGALAQLK